MQCTLVKRCCGAYVEQMSGNAPTTLKERPKPSPSSLRLELQNKCSQLNWLRMFASCGTLLHCCLATGKASSMMYRGWIIELRIWIGANAASGAGTWESI